MIHFLDHGVERIFHVLDAGVERHGERVAEVHQRRAAQRLRIGVGDRTDEHVGLHEVALEVVQSPGDMLLFHGDTGDALYFLIGVTEGVRQIGDAFGDLVVHLAHHRVVRHPGDHREPFVVVEAVDVLVHLGGLVADQPEGPLDVRRRHHITQAQSDAQLVECAVAAAVGEPGRLGQLEERGALVEERLQEVHDAHVGEAHEHLVPTGLLDRLVRREDGRDDPIDQLHPVGLVLFQMGVVDGLEGHRPDHLPYPQVLKVPHLGDELVDRVLHVLLGEAEPGGRFDPAR